MVWTLLSNFSPISLIDSDITLMIFSSKLFASQYSTYWIDLNNYTTKFQKGNQYQQIVL